MSTAKPLVHESIPTAARRWRCDELMEASWLAAVIIVPLTFVPFGSNGFEPYKVAMVRLLAAIMAAAWAVQAGLDRRLPGADRRPPRSVGLALLALLAAQLVSTFFSVDPHVFSFLTNSDPQGICSAAVVAVLFLGVAVFLRRAAQVERLLGALVATSIPVALYALIQHAGFDPMAFAKSEERVSSTLGHPIFLAAYLAMVMPLTWWDIAREAILGWPGAADRPRLFRLLFRIGTAVLQIVAFLCAQSRGPLLGLMAAALVFFLGWAVQTQRRVWAFRIGALLGVATAFVFFLNLPLAASDRAAHALGMERFSNVMGLRNGADAFRKAHWNAGVELMTSTRPIVFPNGGSDRWPGLRPWIGFGPETLANVLPQRYLWPGTQLKVESRLHNRVLDLWCAAGVLGVLTFLAFFLVVFQKGMEQAGLGSPRIIYLLVPGLAIGGGALSCAVVGKAFLGLGIIGGLAAGCVLSILATPRNRTEVSENTEGLFGRRLLIIALLAALVGHLLETGFAFTVQVTSLLFWLYAGLLLALSGLERSAPPAKPSPASRKSRKRGSPNAQVQTGGDQWGGWLAAYGPALILVTLLFAFLQIYTADSMDWRTALARTLTQIKGDQGPSHLIWFLFLPTWLACTFAFAQTASHPSPVRWWIPLTISAAIGATFAVAQGAQLAGIGPLPDLAAPPTTALAHLAGYHSLYFTFVALVIALLLGAAAILRALNAESSSFAPCLPQAVSLRSAVIRHSSLWNVFAAGLASTAAWVLALGEIRAEITGTWGKTLVDTGRLDAGTELLTQCVTEKPDSIWYRRELGNAWIQRLHDPRNSGAADWLSSQAEASLLPAAALARGMSTAGADLARLYLTWAAATPDPERQHFLAQQAATYFQRQQLFAPSQPLSWLDSIALCEFLQQPGEADRQFEIALGLMQSWRIGYWTESYRRQTLAQSSPELRQSYGRLVLRLYEADLRQKHMPADTAHLRLGRASFNAALGRLTEARRECLEVRSSLPQSDQGKADEVLAEIDRQNRPPPDPRTVIDEAIRRAAAGQMPTPPADKSRTEPPPQ